MAAAQGGRRGEQNVLLSQPRETQAGGIEFRADFHVPVSDWQARNGRFSGQNTLVAKHVTIVLVVFTLVILGGLYIWHAQRGISKMQVFVQAAISKYAEDESEVALKYVLIANCTCLGPTRNQVVFHPLFRARSNLGQMRDVSTQQRLARLENLERLCNSRDSSLGDSIALKAELSHDCFRAWRNFDISIFDKI